MILFLTLFLKSFEESILFETSPIYRSLLDKNGSQGFTVFGFLKDSSNPSIKSTKTLKDSPSPF